LSHALTDILKALHLTKGNAIVDVTNGEVVAVYEKENKLNQMDLKTGQGGIGPNKLAYKSIF